MTCKSQLIEPLATPVVNPEKHKETEESLVVALDLRILDDVALLRDVHTVQELSSCQLFSSSRKVSGRDKDRAQHQVGDNHTLRISLFRTLQICWMSAALWDTASTELPVMVSSSFWPLETSTVTPPCIVTRRTSFSPMKLLSIQRQLSDP